MVLPEHMGNSSILKQVLMMARTRVEHLFARLWQWRIVHNVWLRSAAPHVHISMCIFCSTLLNCVFAGRLGISRMDLGLMCHVSLRGHRRRVPLRRRKMMTVFVANCVATILVIYLSVAFVT